MVSLGQLLRSWQTPIILGALLAGLAAASRAAPNVVAPRDVTQCLIWVCLVVGLFAFTGLSGMVSFGQTVFSTISAYGAAWLTLKPFVKHASMPGLPRVVLSSSMPPLESALLCVTGATAIGFLVALTVTRLAAEAATIGTFALLIIVNAVYSNWSSVTGGTSSIVGIPLVVGTWAAFGGAAVAIAAAHAFMQSRTGIMLQASRDDEVAARASGIEVRRCRIAAFTLSAAIAALAGVLQAHFLGVISVDTFFLETTFMTLAMLVVGGRGSLTGAVAGAVLLAVVTSLLRRLEHGVSIGSIELSLPSGVQEVALGAIMLLMLLKRHRGLCGLSEIRLVPSSEL